MSGNIHAFTHEECVKGGRKGALITAERTRKEREARWEDIDFLLDHGYSTEYISKRLGVSAVALARQAYRQAEIEDSDIWRERARRFNYGRKRAA